MTEPDPSASTVTVHATDELSPATRRDVVALCVAANADPAFERLFEYVPSGGRHVVARRNGRIVSHAVVTTRYAQPEGWPVLRTAFVDAVATEPAHQRRGFATAVMRRLGEVVPDYEIGCLQTDIPGLYERVGWELWRGPLAGRRDDGALVPTPHQRGVMVLRLPRTPALAVTGLLTIECQPTRVWEE
jgi:aminoglycoside 2'-N-acetyltransferase I